MAEIKIDHLYKRYSPDTPLAVDDVNMTIADGEFLVLLGPSGCGKTTTLRCVAGLEHQTDGHIYIGDQLVNGLPAGDRDIAFVFQFYALYPHMNAFDNIAFPLRAQKAPKDEVTKRVLGVAKLLKIEHLLRRKPAGLPSGEQQRIALGRAIIRRPQVFLMDEPLTNLDATLRIDMRAELKHLQADLQTTMIYVTHDQTEAMSMADRIAIMNQGVLQQIDDPLTVYNHPATLFVAGFIGSPPMNFIDCQLMEEGVVDASGSISLGVEQVPNLQARAALAQAKGMVLGVRAEDVRLDTAVSDDVIRGQVVVRESLGDELIYTVEVDEHLIRAKTEPTFLLESGDHVSLSFDPQRIHLFDAQTEKALVV